MKKSLVDVPLKINIWIRQSCQKKQWEIIKEARPSILFIQSDGGRNKEEWDAIRANRKMIDESIDWECDVYRFYEEKNLGLYTMSSKVAEEIWKKVDRCIFTEDDQIMSVSFFKFCAEMLEKYKDDQRIECICGMNHLGVYDEVSSDYFFSRQGSIWGVATWKRVYEERGLFNYIDDPYIMKLLKQRTRHNYSIWKQLNLYGSGKHYRGHVPASEFWIAFNMYAQNRLQIIPKYNLISNIGATSDSAHATDLKYLPNVYKKIFNTPLFDMPDIIKHPKYVIPDVEYEKKRNFIMGSNRPFITYFRKIIMLVKLAFNLRFDIIFKKLNKGVEK